MNNKLLAKKFIFIFFPCRYKKTTICLFIDLNIFAGKFNENKTYFIIDKNMFSNINTEHII